MNDIDHERLMVALRASVARARAAQGQPLPEGHVPHHYVCPCRQAGEMCDDCWNAP